MEPTPTGRVQAVIDRLYSQEKVPLPDGTDRDLFPLSITRAEGEALRSWAQRTGATRTLETGLAFGVSALFICGGLLTSGATDMLHVACDPNQSTAFQNAGLRELDAAGVDHLVEFREEASEILLPRLLTEGRRFDLAFIDGNHRFEGVFLDLMFAGRLVENGGVIFVDDHQLPAIGKAVAFCTANLGWTIEETSTDDDLHHWVVLRTRTHGPLERTFDDFTDF